MDTESSPLLVTLLKWVCFHNFKGPRDLIAHLQNSLNYIPFKKIIKNSTWAVILLHQIQHQQHRLLLRQWKPLLFCDNTDLSHYFRVTLNLWKYYVSLSLLLAESLQITVHTAKLNEECGIILSCEPQCEGEMVLLHGQ